MGRLVALLVLGVCWPITSALAAEDPSLEFLHGLRERGYHDLALEYLLRLRERTEPPVPEEVKKVLPLEIARSQADVALRESDPAKRQTLVNQSRDAMQAFVNDAGNAKHPALGDTY